MKRTVKYTLIFTFSLIGILLLLLFAIAGTERGTLWAWQQAQRFLPETVQAGRVSGRLAGPLQLDNLNLATDQINLKIDHGELDWSPRSLLKSVLTIDRLLLNGMHITTKAPTTGDAVATEPVSLPAEITLPGDIVLENFELNDFQYRASTTSEPFIINHARLDASHAGNHLTIKALQVSAPLFQLDAQAELDTRDNYPLEGNINWQVNPADYKPLKGHSRITGSLQKLHIDSQLAAPYNAIAAIQLQDPLNDLAVTLDLTIDQLNPSTIQPDWPDMPLAATTRSSYKSGAVTIDHVSVKRFNQPGNLHSHGTISLIETQPVFDLNTTWQQLQWPLEGESQISSPEGRLHTAGTLENLTSELFAKINSDGEISGRIDRRDKNILMALNWKNLTLPVADTLMLLPKGTAEVNGTLDNYLIKLDTALDVPDKTSGYIKVAGRGSTKQLQLDSVDINALDGELNGTANISWQPTIDLRLDLKGRNLNPGVLYAEWPGRLAPIIQLTANNTTGEWQAQTSQTQIRGELRGFPVDLTAQASYEKQKLELTTLRLLSGKSHLDVSGTVDKQINLAWQLNSNNLGEVWPDAAGKINGKGEITGALPYPKINASLQGESISVNVFGAGTIDLNTSLDTRLQDPSTLQVTLENGRYADMQIATASLQAAGMATEHTAKLIAKTSQGNLDLALQGELENPWQSEAVWHAVIQRVDIAHPELAGWKLEQPVRALVSKQTMQLEQGCWTTTPTGRLCIEGKQATVSSGKFQLSDLPLAYFQPLYPPDIQLQVTLNGSGNFSGMSGQALQGAIEFSTTSGQLLSSYSSASQDTKESVADTTGLHPLLTFEPSKASVVFDKTGISLLTQLNLQNDDHLQLDLVIKEDTKPFMERPVTGQLQASLRDLSFIDVLSYEIDNTRGQLQANMQLSGQAGKPQLTGLLELREFSTRLIQPGLTLKDGQLTLAGNEQQGLALNATVTSGKGQLVVKGSVNPLEKQLADISLKGENVTLVDTPDAHVVATPDLTLAISDERIDLNGRLIIPYADITPRKLPESAVTASSDQIIMKPGQEETDKPLRRALHADLYLILGEEVNVDSLGLTAKIAGAVRIQEQPGEPATGSGELKIVEGKYKAYGQDLTIEQGRVLFTGGPVSRPGLDIRAVRRPRENIEVGVQVRGSLKKPDFSLFSSPSMTQQVQLSYLIFGRPPNESSGAENSALSRAAMALGMKGGDFLTKNIGQHIGIDEIGIESAPSTTET